MTVGADAPRVPGEVANHERDDDAPDALHEPGDRSDVLLDEGVEETFPASDPVAVKHIT